MSRHPYNQQEDNTIMDCVSKSPTNLRVAFEVASNLLSNRSVKGISQRYYNKLAKSTISIIATGSAQTIAVNQKNSRRTQIVPEASTVRDAMLFASVSTLAKDKAIKLLISNLDDNAKRILLTRIITRINGR